MMRDRPGLQGRGPQRNPFALRRGAGAFRSPAPVLRTQTPNDQFAV